MVKNIIAEEALQGYWDQFVVDNTPVAGLIIGKITNQKDYAVKLIKCPDTEESGKEFQINDAWVAGSALEISHMLPGGLSVIGVFAVTHLDDNMQSSLRQTLYHCHKMLSKMRKINVNEDSLLTALHIDLNTGKPFSCKQYDMRVSTSSAKPMEWKYQNCSTSWSLIKTNLKIDETIHVKKISSNLQQLKELVEKYSDKISKAIVCINGNISQSSDLFDSNSASSMSKGKKSKVSLKKWGKTFLCQVYLQSEETVGIDKCQEVKPLTCKNTIHVKGTIFTCAYLPAKATIEEAVNELKNDAINSLYRRCNLVVEEVSEQEQEITDNLNILLPKRLGFTNSKNSDDFLYFDYVFENEAKEDSVLRVKEIFDTLVEPESMISDLEEFPTLTITDQEVTSLHTSESFSVNPIEPVKPGYNATIGAVVGAVIAVLAAGLSYLTLSEA